MIIFAAGDVRLRDGRIPPAQSPGVVVEVANRGMTLTMREVAELRDALTLWLWERGRS